MKIIISDLDINSTLKQTDLISLLGGFKRYGSWKLTAYSASGIRRGATHMSNYWVRKGRLFKRNGHQHGSKVITLRYVRNVTEWLR